MDGVESPGVPVAVPRADVNAREASGVQVGSGNIQYVFVGGDVLPRGWPRLIGAMPPEADRFHERDLPGELADRLSSGGLAGAAVVVVLSGLGGVGKTQLAAHVARRGFESGDLDLVVWIPGSSRDAIVAGFADAAGEVGLGGGRDAEQEAARFLAWLAQTGRRWLVVVDDLVRPADLRGLWPATSATGIVLVTSRRRDAALAGDNQRLVEVGPFTAPEAVDYLAGKLSPVVVHRADLARLAADLGFLPLALAQAATYMRDRGLDCAAYRARLADRRRRLSDLVPEPDALPDDHRSTVAATWSLSVELANGLIPVGLAGPLLQLLSMLDPHGIPASLLATSAVSAFLTGDGRERPVDEDEAADALHCLHRVNLVSLDPTNAARSVRVHALVQRATQDDLDPHQVSRAVDAAADGLVEMWPDIDRDRRLAQSLRANTRALAATDCDVLWSAGMHPVLIRLGRSLTDAGLIAAALAHWRDLYDIATGRLGAEHADTLAVRAGIAECQAWSGHHLAAAATLDRLADDYTRLLGPDHLMTLTTRRDAADWRGHAGYPAAAVTVLTRLVEDCIRVLGAGHPETLTTRHILARWRGESGDPAGAAAALQQLLTDQLRLLGGDHPHTLATRNNLARWRGEAGDPAGAVTTLTEVLADCERILGPDHPDTLGTRHHLAKWRGQAGEPAGAATAFAELLRDAIRVLGSDHPRTLVVRRHLAHTCGQQGDPLAAVHTLEDLVADCQRVLGPHSPHTLTTRHDLAEWRGQTGDAAGAAVQLQALLRDCVRALGPDHPTTLLIRHTLARWLGRSGNIRAAITTLEQVLTDQTRVLGPDHPGILATRNNLARWRGDAGQHTQAITELRAVLTDCLRILGPDHPDTLSTRHLLARQYGEAGQPQAAATALANLIPDYQRILGPRHPNVRVALQTLARWQKEANIKPVGKTVT